ncbi:MAG: hypothetical protein M1840_005641 [Geoglossum simile]|nr:MAG: hypothetical protein M1840_005641 [Geoglossum simile]
MNGHMTKTYRGSGLGDLPLPKLQPKSSTRIPLNMSGSEGSGGIAVLLAVIPGSIIANAASKINKDEVLAVLSTNPTDGENRVYLEKSGDALELIYEHFKQVNKATLVQIIGVSVGAVEEHTPGKAIFVHRDNGRGFWAFGRQSGVLIVLIPIIQPIAVQDYETLTRKTPRSFLQPLKRLRYLWGWAGLWFTIVS